MAIFVGQNVYIRPTYVVSLPEYYSEYSGMSEAMRANMANLQNNAHRGIISKKADKGIRNAINWLLCAAEPKKVYNSKSQSWFEFKVNFITLTLPDTKNKITDHDFKTKLLNPFLTYMRKYQGLKNYVWKLEFQKNGKLHLHITTDTFIHHAKIRRTWNKLLGSNSYLIDFAEKFGHTNPNSTDIHSVRKIKNLGAYLAKYMGKNDALLKEIKGRIWGCNYEISRANKTKIHIPATECANALKSLMSTKIDWRKMSFADKYSGELREWGEIFFLKYTDWQKNIKGQIKELFFDTILGLKNIMHDGTLFAELNTV